MQKKIYWLAFLLLLATTESRIAKIEQEDDLIVQTSKGPVRGITTTSAHGKPVVGFLGIPFAKPPIGPLRYRRPEPIDPWTEVFDASTPPSACMQSNDTFFGDFNGSTVWNPNTPISEDCLKLSVWMPKPRPEGSPVLVWIYGGGFCTGSSALDIYDPKTVASEEQIILVLLNYRLGSFGFLFLDRDDAPGNVGLLDQVMALEWVRDNIAKFGGNPDKVTIFGESAGAGSVGLHLMSPVSRNLYSQAIMQSGSPLAPWAVTANDIIINHGLTLAKNLKCPNDPSKMEEVIECLRSRDPFELMAHEPESYGKGPLEFAFTPVVDGTFLTEMPHESIAKNNMKSGPVMMGSNSEEGSSFAIYFFTQYFKRKENVYLNRDAFIDCVKQVTYNYSNVVQEAAIFLYTDWSDIEDPVKNRDALIQLLGDWKFSCPVHEFGQQYATAGNDVYMYYFKHRSTINPWPQWMGVLHGDEINFIFGEPLNPKFNYVDEEGALSRKMMRYWCNFAKTGNPNVRRDGRHELVIWPRHTPSNREYLALEVNSIEIGKARKARECTFWENFVPKLEESTRHCTNMV